MKTTHNKRPAAAVTANGPQLDRLGGAINKSPNITEAAAAQPRRFQLQAYRVLSHPDERLMAVTDKITCRMLGRIAAGKHDCVLCRTTLDLNPESDSSPGIVGYVHGSLPEDVDSIGVTVCVRCVEELGDQAAAKKIMRMFLDEKCGGGTIELVQGGVA